MTYDDKDLIIYDRAYHLCLWIYPATSNYTELNDIDNITPLVGVRVRVRVTTDEAGLNFVSKNCTDVFGKIVFHLNAGTYWFSRYRINTIFVVNPIQFIVS